MKTKLHALAGSLALVTIGLFWTATVCSELAGHPDWIRFVKAGVVRGMLVLIPLMVLTGASGFALGARLRGPLIGQKKRRMKIIAATGLLVLVPAAVFLALRAEANAFDGWFYLVQAVELVAGASNFILLGLNMGDGFRLSGKRRL